MTQKKVETANCTFRPSFWVGEKTLGCQHLAEYAIDEILSLRTWEDKKLAFYTEDGRRVRVKMNSLRYHVFANSPVCACCGLVGTYMMLDVHGKIYSRAHFNLYGEVSGQLILITKDHIIPRSKGGSNCLDNLQTLCTRCNAAKADKQLSVDELYATLISEPATI